MAAVLVHIDLDGDRPHASSLVALSAGRHVASSWGATLYAALIVHDSTARSPSPGTAAPLITSAQLPGIEAIEDRLARAGADKVVVAITDGPVLPLWAAVGNAWHGVVEHLRPRLVLFGADSPSADELAPRTAARIGARLLLRAGAFGGHEVELRDRDGGYARISDGGAAVALIGRADPAPAGDDDIDLVVMSMLGGADQRVELAGTAPAEPTQTIGAMVAIADDVAADSQLVPDAKRLATLLDAQLIASPSVARSISACHAVDRTTALAPGLCVMIGAAQLDIASSASVIKIGAQSSKAVDGALPGPAGVGLAELVRGLEQR